MLVRLSQLLSWERFPDGVSLDHDRRVSRLIKRLGMLVKVELAANDHDALEKAIQQAEQGKAESGW